MKIIYSREKLTNDFKELCLNELNNNDDVLENLNNELLYQYPAFHQDYGSICSERPLISYYRGISIIDMELEEGNNVKLLAMEVTNKIRTKVRRTLKKSYRKFMKQSDLKAIEKALFQYYDDNFDAGFGIDLSKDGMSELDEIFGNDNWGEVIDFSIEEMLDMPVMGDESNKQINIVDNETHDNSNHGIFCVTEKDLD